MHLDKPSIKLKCDTSCEFIRFNSEWNIADSSLSSTLCKMLKVEGLQFIMRPTALNLRSAGYIKLTITTSLIQTSTHFQLLLREQ
jgi:hypothetical protein